MSDPAGRTGGRGGFDTPFQLNERVAAYVRDQVMAGQLRAGTFIRPEHVAAELGVSATPVREALMSLVGDGTVQWRPRRGFQVAPIRRQDIEDIFSVQSFIAGELAARAARTMTPEELNRLIDVQDRLEQAERAADIELVVELNHEIHRSINLASPTTRLTTLLNLTVHYVPRRYFGQVPGWSDASAHDHTAIFAALQARDAEASRSAMTAHIEHIGALLADHLQDRGVFTSLS